MLKYKNRFGDADVYASYLFSDSDYLPATACAISAKAAAHWAWITTSRRI